MDGSEMAGELRDQAEAEFAREFCGKVVSGNVARNDHFITTCMEPPDHEGPHVGPVMWAVD